jgi:regulator of sirC expression with transglutaminase-like and TPR domain
MVIEELWSREDEARLTAFEKAVALDDLAGALLAIEGVPEGRARETLAGLGSLAEQVRSKLSGATEPAVQAMALCEVLGQEAGLRLLEGSQPESGLLAATLERGSGDPVVLEAIWLEVARRAGIEAKAMSGPGKLLIRVGSVASALVEPAAGQLVLADERSGAPQPARPPLRPVSDAELLGAVLAALVNAQLRRNGLLEVFRAISFLCALRPQAPAASLQRAAIAEQLGAFNVAGDIYRQVMQQFPGSQESALASSKLDEVRARTPRMLQ